MTKPDTRQQPDPPAGERTGKRPRHEGDEPIAQRDEREPRSVGKLGHRDLQRGVQDTDIRGGNEYQQRTQDDSRANSNSERGEKGGGE